MLPPEDNDIVYEDFFFVKTNFEIPKDDLIGSTKSMRAQVGRILQCAGTSTIKGVRCYVDNDAYNFWRPEWVVKAIKIEFRRKQR